MVGLAAKVRAEQLLKASFLFSSAMLLLRSIHGFVYVYIHGAGSHHDISIIATSNNSTISITTVIISITTVIISITTTVIISMMLHLSSGHPESLAADAKAAS